MVGNITTDDFCRVCKGTGYMTAAPGELVPRCRYCEGTGKQTVRVLEKGEEEDRKFDHELMLKQDAAHDE